MMLWEVFTEAVVKPFWTEINIEAYKILKQQTEYATEREKKNYFKKQQHAYWMYCFEYLLVITVIINLDFSN